MLLIKPLCGLAVLGCIVWLLGWILGDYTSGQAEVEDVGRLVVDSRNVHLYGVDGLDAAQTCTFGSRRWLCGRDASQALRQWLGARTVRCLPEGRTVSGEIEGLCYAGTEDLSQWVVENGWGLADSHSTPRYVAVEARARAKLVGLWSSSFIVPRLWRISHRGRQRSRPTAEADLELATSSWVDRWRVFLPVAGVAISFGLLVHWFPRVWTRLIPQNMSPTHAWRVRRSRRLIGRIREIGRVRGAAAQFAYLRKVDPLVVEELVLSAFEVRGHKIQRNARYTGDGGVDGRCWIDGEPYLIQVKRYGSFVSAQHVAEFGALCAIENAKGLFVHTGRTGAGARVAAGATVTIVSGSGLLQMLGLSESQEDNLIADPPIKNATVNVLGDSIRRVES